MKKLLIAFLLISSALSHSFAQANFILIPTDTDVISVTVNSGDIAEGFLKVKNISAHNDTIKWVAANKSGPHDWTANVCDIVNCYAFSYTVRTFILGPGDTGTMRMDLDPLCQPGTGEIRLKMWEQGDSAGKVLYPTWILNITTSPNCVAAGINDNHSVNTLQLFPNPIQNTFTVTGLENATGVSFEVFDLKGALVKSETINKTNISAEISIADLPSGMYVLKALDKENRIAGTARLSKVD